MRSNRGFSLLTVLLVLIVLAVAGSSAVRTMNGIASATR